MSYAEAAASGALAPESESSVPISHVNVTDEEAKEAKEAVDDALEELEEDKKKAENAANQISRKVQEEFSAAYAQLQDPTVQTTTVATTVLSVASAACYLSQEHKLGRLEWPAVALASAAVVVASLAPSFYSSYVAKSK